MVGLCALGVVPCRGLFVWYGYSDLCILGYGLCMYLGLCVLSVYLRNMSCVYRLVEVGIACMYRGCV